VRTSEAIRFSGELKEYFPAFVAQLTPEAQEQLKADLQKRAEGEPDQQLKAALNALLATVK